MLDPMLEALLPGFVEESAEICERATRSLLELERQPAAGPVFDDLARGLHTLKGSAATLGLMELSDFAHKMEDVVLPLRGSEKPLPPKLADAILRSLDVWLAHLRATAARTDPPDLKQSYALLGEAGSEGKPAASGVAASTANVSSAPVSTAAASTAQVAAPPEHPISIPPVGSEAPPSTSSDPPQVGPDGEASWRVGTRQVTQLMREVERLREVRLRLDERRREIDRALTQLSMPALAPTTFEVRALLIAARRALGADAEEAADVVASMEDGLKSIATMPLRTVVDPLRRTVRDLCKSSGKEVRLSVVGAEVSLDRRALEELRGPLVHLVRNAVDHGFELPQVREARGKHREGALIIRVEQQGNMLFLEVADDGGGIDLVRVREVARETGIATEDELQAMQPAQLQQLIFRPGFSTRREVTDVSGRGVGLDVVVSQMQALRGHVEVQTTPGQGTRFLLSLPAELGSSPVLVVRVGEHVIGIPMAAVESSKLAAQDDLRIGRTRMQIVHRGQLLPVVDLGAVLGLRQPEAPAQKAPVLVIQSQAGRIALSVDEVLGDRELVIRPLPLEVRDIPAWQGAATLARGELMPILRPDFLSGAGKTVTASAQSRRALVVDDSLTARALHRTALEAGGFQVHTAASGKQALEQLEHTGYDVLVSDIGMAEMDGYELTRAVRKLPDAKAMPILLVSAREAPQERQRGEAAGADGFLTKRECVEGRLLSEVTAVMQRRKGGR
ncbi:MAG TPA: response regulator [Myxococcales bacterium]